MALLDRFRKKKNEYKEVNEYFKLLNMYSPTFTTRQGGVYEMILTRSAIHSFASHVSKLKAVSRRDSKVERVLQQNPNPWQNASAFLYQLATIYEIENNAFIIPILDVEMNINGFIAMPPSLTEVGKIQGKTYLKYELFNEKKIIEFARVGRLGKFQYKNQLFGEDNSVMDTTMELMDTNEQGIINGIRNGASIRFLGKLATTLHSEDIEKERKRIVKEQLGTSNNGGIMLFDQKYEDIKQIDSKPFTIDEKQSQQIKDNVFSYFGTNQKILTNTYDSKEWNAYYEGKIEPFALMLSLVLTNMYFTERERGFGNEIIFTANRLQYLSNEEKLRTVTQLFDRGFLTHNQGLEIFNMAGIGEEGEKNYIRREYVEIEQLGKDTSDNLKMDEMNTGEESTEEEQEEGEEDHEAENN